MREREPGRLRVRRRDLVVGFATAFGALACSPLRVNRGGAEPDGLLRVMSFKIRYGTANDGPNHWDLRKGFLVDVLREQQADVIGVQEALYPQLTYLLEALPEYAMVGVGRDDGERAGEFACVLYRRALLTVARSGTFWFSDTPEVVASTSWGNRITRICTWAEFADARGQRFAMYNVHLDHESQPSRERSVALLRAQVAARHPRVPVLVTGDFNAGEANPAVLAMTAGGAYRDTYRVRHPDAAPVGTFTAFQLGQVNGDKIDYVFADRSWDVRDAGLVRTARDGRYPSDHFPVTAVVAPKR